MYEEEEWKRYYESLQEGYKAVGFSYEQPNASDTTQNAAEAEEVDEPFMPPEELMVPAGILLPPTVKVHARIEKTATFIAQHGIQMEIMIKTKQSRNPQFEFLSFENPLNAYYKHLVQIIKSGKYKPKQQEQSTQQENDHGDQHYLHPSLSTTNLQTQLPPPPPPKKIEMPKVNVHDTHYGQLISSLKKYSNQRPVKEEAVAEVSAAQQPALPPFMAQPDYGGTSTLDQLPSSAAHHHHHHHHTHHSSHASHHHGNHGRGKEERTEPPPPGTEAARPLTQAQAASNLQQGCEDRSSPGPHQIVPPPPDIQPIIDRMAMYVAKNGVEFEFVVKCKKDPRFAFLESGHMHFQYYDFKKNMFLKEAELKKRLEAKQAERERQKREEEAAAAANRSISFSIKGRSKDPEAASGRVKRPLFDYDSSGEDTDENGRRKDVTSRSSTPDSVSLRAAAIASSATAMAAVAAAETRPAVPPDELEKRQAEERLKHKLAVAAREKLVSSNKEKQLQLERKKKAALFINLLRIVKDAPMPDDTPKEVRDAETPPKVETKIPTPPSSVPVFDYNNRSGTPTRLDKADAIDILRRSRSRSPLESRSRQRKRSLSPPSAYAITHRYSPPKRRSPRRGLVSARHVSPLIRPCRVRRSSPVPSRQKRSRSPQKKKIKRTKSRSASPSSKQHKKKHKRSRSKTPKKKKKARSRSKDRESSKHGRERASDKYHDKRKEKEKKKERDKKEKEKKDKHKSKDSRSKTDREKKSKDVKSSSDKVLATFSEKRRYLAPSLAAEIKPEEEAEIINSSSADSGDSSESEIIDMTPNGNSLSRLASAKEEIKSTLDTSSITVSSTSLIASESQLSVAGNESAESFG